MIRRSLAFAGLGAVLVFADVLIVHKERVLAQGTPILLELAPRDPRSLIAGDYMVLDYAVSRAAGEPPARQGTMIVRLDGDGVARFVRFDDGRTAPGKDELRLRYKQRGWRVRLGAEAFYFQEGHASLYQDARYAQLRVARTGQSVLVGLNDKERRPLGRRRG